MAPKRVRATKAKKDIMLNVTKPALKRVSQRSGCRRMKAVVYDEARDMLRGFLTKVLFDAALYTKSRNRMTVSADDVEHALRNNNASIYYAKKK